MQKDEKTQPDQAEPTPSSELEEMIWPEPTEDKINEAIDIIQKDKKLTEKDYVDLATLAIHESRHRVFAEKEAITDKLTDIASRLSYGFRLENEINRIERTKKPVSLLLIDIDNFKKFNDKYGHKTGDTVLKDAAHIIQENLPRKMDMVARYGGEEFAVILPETDSEGAYFVAERIRMAIEEKTKEKNLPVTISVGHATFDVEDKEINSIEKLEMAADTALYQSKKDGRNRVTTFEKDMKMPSSIEKLSKKLLCTQHDLARLSKEVNKEKRIYEIIERSNQTELVDYLKEKITSLEDQIEKTEIEIEEVEKAIETEKRAMTVA